MREPNAHTSAAVRLPPLEIGTSMLSTRSFPIVPGLESEAVVMFQTPAGTPDIAVASVPN